MLVNVNLLTPVRGALFRHLLLWVIYSAELTR
jgi:hypothetical protein